MTAMQLSHPELTENTRSDPVDPNGEPDWSLYPANYPAAFVRFHDKNDWVYHAIVRQARELKARKFTGVGVRWIYEGLRYGEEASAHKESNEGLEFGLDNDHAAFYGRLIESRERDLLGFFRLRPLSRPIIKAGPLTLSMDFSEEQST